MKWFSFSLFVISLFATEIAVFSAAAIATSNFESLPEFLSKTSSESVRSKGVGSTPPPPPGGSQ